MTEEVQKNAGISRRAIVKGAAWSVPVVAAAVATPLAAASVAGTLASVALTTPTSSLLTLNLLDGGGTVTAGVLTTVPTIAALTSDAGAITAQTAAITISVARPTGVNISVGTARGFGVYSVNGVLTTPAQRSAVYQTAPIVGAFGFPLTSWSGTAPVTIAANGTLNLPVVFGLAGTSSGVAISALTNFAVTLSVTINGVTRTAAGTITVPVGAGIL